MPNDSGERKAHLRIVMERDFDEFSAADRDEFIKDLRVVMGVEPEALRDVIFKRGCVLFEARLAEMPIESLIDTYKAIQSPQAADRLHEVRVLVSKYSITNITATFSSSLQIRTQGSAQPPLRGEGHEIVFVHGFTGDKTTFGDLPRYLGSEFMCQTRVFEYPTGWISHSPSIYYLSAGFDTWFRNHVKGRRVAIIAHSMGGLVARKFVTLQAYRSAPLDGSIRQMTFVASPHDGANLATIGKRIIGVDSDQIRDLAPAGSFVAELKEAWGTWLKKNPEQAAAVRSIYSPADAIVNPANAMGGSGDGDVILDVSHQDIVKPKSATAPIVLTIARYLEEAGFRGKAV